MVVVLRIRGLMSKVQSRAGADDVSAQPEGESIPPRLLDIFVLTVLSVHG